MSSNQTTSHSDPASPALNNAASEPPEAEVIAEFREGSGVSTLGPHVIVIPFRMQDDAGDVSEATRDWCWKNLDHPIKSYTPSLRRGRACLIEFETVEDEAAFRSHFTLSGSKEVAAVDCLTAARRDEATSPPVHTEAAAVIAAAQQAVRLFNKGTESQGKVGAVMRARRIDTVAHVTVLIGVLRADAATKAAFFRDNPVPPNSRTHDEEVQCYQALNLARPDNTINEWAYASRALLTALEKAPLSSDALHAVKQFLAEEGGIRAWSNKGKGKEALETPFEKAEKMAERLQKLFPNLSHAEQAQILKKLSAPPTNGRKNSTRSSGTKAGGKQRRRLRGLSGHRAA
jgi:Ni/Co efflux regulator RcnB